MPTGPFRPGDKVPATGIYTASHYQHRMPHEVFAVEGEQFPACRRCGERASFSLAHPAVHIEADQDFANLNQSKTVTQVKAGSSKKS